MGQYNPREGQTQVQIPFGKKQELDALRAKVQQDMARPEGDPERITDMQAAQQLQEAATGKSDPLTDLKKMRLGGGGEETVDMQMQKNFAPWSGGESPMANNPTQPMAQDFRGDETGQFPGPPGAGQPDLQQDAMTKLAMMNREKAGPMDAVRQTGGGLLQQGMDGLRGMGRSLGASAKSLFDDPQRMAMLQGGLSMMDPNSYYDKQGFGSVFTGLNKGLGAAQLGHKGVLDRRALVQKTATAKAAADKATRGGNPVVRDIGGGLSQMWKDGAAYGPPYKTTEPGGADPTYVKLINYRDGFPKGSPQYVEAQKVISKMGYVRPNVTGTNTDVILTQPIFKDDGTVDFSSESVMGKGNRPPTQVQVAEAESSVKSGGRGTRTIGSLYKKLEESSSFTGGELFGDNVVSNWNTFVDNIGMESLGNEDRRNIDALQNSLKRDLPRAYLEDDKSKSNFDKQLVLETLGYSGNASRSAKMKNMPDVLGMTYERYAKNQSVAGGEPLPLREYLEKKGIPEALIKEVEKRADATIGKGAVGSTGGSGQTATGYTPGSQSKHF